MKSSAQRNTFCQDCQYLQARSEGALTRLEPGARRKVMTAVVAAALAHTAAGWVLHVEIAASPEQLPDRPDFGHGLPDAADVEVEIGVWAVAEERARRNRNDSGASRP